jgi:hypothetical protein
MIKFAPWKQTRGIVSYDVPWGFVSVEGWEPYVTWLALYTARQYFTVISTPRSEKSLFDEYLNIYTDIYKRIVDEMSIPKATMDGIRRQAELLGE